METRTRNKSNSADLVRLGMGEKQTVNEAKVLLPLEICFRSQERMFIFFLYNLTGSGKSIYLDILVESPKQSKYNFQNLNTGVTMSL